MSHLVTTVTSLSSDRSTRGMEADVIVALLLLFYSGGGCDSRLTALSDAKRSSVEPQYYSTYREITAKDFYYSYVKKHRTCWLLVRCLFAACSLPVLKSRSGGFSIVTGLVRDQSLLCIGYFSNTFFGEMTVNGYSALNPCRLNLIPPTSVQSSKPTASD